MYNSNIVVATVQTAARLVIKGLEFRKFLAKCDLLVIDEYHVNKAKQLQFIVKWCRARMRFGLSGTIDKYDLRKMLLFESITGPVIAEVRNKELVELGRSAKPYIRLITIREKRVDTETYSEAYQAGTVNHKKRNLKVVSEVLRYLNRGKRVLVTISRIHHGILLKNLLADYTDVPSNFIQGSTPLSIRDKAKEDFIKGRAPILIASPIFDVGEDFPEGIDAWVNAAGGCGWELILQRLGRVLRKKAVGKNVVYVTDFIDAHEKKYLMEHSLKRFEYYLREKIAKIKVLGWRDEDEAS